MASRFQCLHASSIGRWIIASVGETSSMAINFYETLKHFPKPIISRINGSALGGGWGLLFNTDIRVATEGAWFSFAEVKRGIVPAIISAYVVPELGPFHSRKLFLTGEKVTAQKAKDLGFLSDVAKDEAELDKIVASYVEQLLENGPKAMKVVKNLVQHHGSHSHEDNINHVKGIFEKYVVTSKEARYGMECFMCVTLLPKSTSFLLEHSCLVSSQEASEARLGIVLRQALSSSRVIMFLFYCGIVENDRSPRQACLLVHSRRAHLSAVENSI